MSIKIWRGKWNVMQDIWFLLHIIVHWPVNNMTFIWCTNIFHLLEQCRALRRIFRRLIGPAGTRQQRVCGPLRPNRTHSKKNLSLMLRCYGLKPTEVQAKPRGKYLFNSPVTFSQQSCWPSAEKIRADWFKASESTRDVSRQTLRLQR